MQKNTVFPIDLLERQCKIIKFFVNSYSAKVTFPLEIEEMTAKDSTRIP